MQKVETSGSSLAMCWGLGGLVAVGLSMVLGGVWPALIAAGVGCALAFALIVFMQTVFCELPRGHWGPLEGPKGVPGWDRDEPEVERMPAAATPAPAEPKNTAKMNGSTNDPDDLKKITGIGPVLERKLNDLGIRHFGQIASWTPQDIARIDEELKFSGRIERDDWVGQASDLQRKA